MVPEWVTGDVPRWCAVAELPNFPEFAGYLYKFGDDYNVAHWPLWVGNDNVSRPDEARFKRKS